MPSTKKDLLGVRLNNAGQLIYQAACSGELEKLELVFNSIPEKEGEGGSYLHAESVDWYFLLQ